MKYLYVHGKPIEVSDEVYKEYYRSIEKDRYTYRKIRTGRLVLLGELLYDPNDQSDAIDILLIRLDLKRALSLLDEIDRYIIKRLYLDGWTLAMVGESLGISHVAVFKRKNKALKLLKRRLEE